jgi:hypothetical protein
MPQVLTVACLHVNAYVLKPHRIRYEMAALVCEVLIVVCLQANAHALGPHSSLKSYLYICPIHMPSVLIVFTPTRPHRQKRRHLVADAVAMR